MFIHLWCTENNLLRCFKQVQFNHEQNIYCFPVCLYFYLFNLPVFYICLACIPMPLDARCSKLAWRWRKSSGDLNEPKAVHENWTFAFLFKLFSAVCIVQQVLLCWVWSANAIYQLNWPQISVYNLSPSAPFYCPVAADLWLLGSTLLYSL